MNWLLVALGGALGSMARYGLSLWLAPQSGQFPWATLFANILGCFTIGVLFVIIVERQWLPIAFRPLLMVGFLGGLTTFSTFSLEALAMWQSHRFTPAIIYVTSSVLVSLFAVWLGYTLAEKTLQP